MIARKKQLRVITLNEFLDIWSKTHSFEECVNSSRTFKTLPVREKAKVVDAFWEAIPEVLPQEEMFEQMNGGHNQL